MSQSSRLRRNGDDEMSGTRRRSDSTPLSTPKRKSSKRNDPDRDGGFNPISTNFSSTSQTPYPEIAAPSVASSYATANTTYPMNLPYRPPDLIRNESMTSQRAISAGEPTRESRKKRDSDTRRERSSDSDNNNNQASRRSKRSDKDDGRRSSRKDNKPRRTDSERALDNHRASMVENQFPGEFPPTFAEPYRPPGLAAEYYGDHGESVAEQPGVRPAPPSVITDASQAHLHEATIEAAPPPEPSSLGLVGAAASFYAGTGGFESDSQSQPSKPTNRPGSKPKPYGTSPRSSPGPPERPGSIRYSATGVGSATPAGAGVGATVGTGQAAEYFSSEFRPDLTEGGSNMAPSGKVAYQSMQAPIQGAQASTQGSMRPPLASQKPSSGSNMPLYGAAAAGIATVGAGAYYAGHHTTEEHHSMDNLAASSYGPQNTGHSSSLPQNFHSQPPMQQRRRRRGPFAKIVDFFQDPAAVAEYEAYTEAIGVCKYCFDPGSSPRDGPRKHHYNRRSSDARYGSSVRVDKLNRYPSSEEEKRRRSNGKKWVATGLAGYGLAKMSEAAANRRNGFDDTYSVKSGRPEASTRVSFAADERESSSRKTKHSSGDDRSYSRQNSRRDDDIRIRKDRKTGQLYEERSSRRGRDSSTSERFSKGAAVGAAVSAGVAAGGLAAATSHRNRSNSPKKRYYSKRVSPNHSYVDLSTTNSAALGFGSFFNSPSANQRKGKKPKGLGFFNFTNASSSSSDADLAFGAGSVRRKRNRRNDRKARDDGTVNTEILGLAATGVALAAERDKEDRKGKRRADLMVVKEPRGDRPRRRDKRYLQSPHSESDELHDDWIDESSVDSALAYGGGLSARQSRESLASSDGTDKWDWRWNKGKKPRKKPSLDPSRFEPAALGLAGGAAASSGRYGPAESNASLQSLQQLDPVPMSDPNAFEADRKASAIPPLTGMAPPVLAARTESASLRHPQPVAPVSPAVYSQQGSAPPPAYNPDGTPVFSQYPPPAPMTESPKQLPVDVQTQRPRSDEKPRRRRDSSPTPSQTREGEFDDSSGRRASARDSVKFDLTEEQIEKDRRAQRRERRRLERKSRSGEKLVESTNFEQEASLKREKDEVSSGRRSSAEARTAREQEIERELERLYEEDRQQKEARKSKRAGTWPTAAAIGAGVAGFTAAAAAESASLEDEAKPEREERQSRRKPALRQTTPSRMSDDDQSDSQQRRIARMAAARVSSKPSPAHDDYASYFIPPELADKVEEHNFAAQHRDDPIEQAAQIVEVAPRTAQRKDTFDPFLYRPFGIEPEDDPRQFSWPVPLLDIIEPTPPVSVRGDVSPLPSKSPEPPEVPEVSEEIPEERQERSSSVTRGEHRTHEYEVVTPLEDHEGSVRTATYESSQPAIDLAESTHSDVRPELSEPVTVFVGSNGMPLSTAEKDVPAPAPVIQEQEQRPSYGQDLEFAAILAAGTESAGFDPAIVVDDPTYHRRDSPPGSEAASFYQAPGAETGSGLGSFHDYSVPPQKGLVEGEIPSTPAEVVPKEFELVHSEDYRTAAEDEQIDVEPKGLELVHGEDYRTMAEGERIDVEPEGPELFHSEDYRTTAEDERIDVEPKIPGGFDVNVFDYFEDLPAVSKSVNVDATQEPVAVSLGEEDEKLRKSENMFSETHILPAESVVSVTSDPGQKPNRSATLDDASFDKSLDQSGPQVSYASDPEGSGEERSKKSSRKSSCAAEAVVVGAAATAVPVIGELRNLDRGRRKLERDHYERLPSVSASEPAADISVDPRRSSWKPKRDSDMWDDTKSTISSPAELRDDRGSGKRSKKEFRRDSPSVGDDAISVSSLPADLNGDKSASRRGKDKKSGSLFGWLSSSKSETSTSPKQSFQEMDLPSMNEHDMKSEGPDDPKRRSRRKSRDKDDVSSDLYRSRSHSQPSVKDDLKQGSPEDEFLSSEETTRDDEQREDGISFLGERPELPTVLDGGSGLKPETLLDAEQGISVEPPSVLYDPVSSVVRSRSISPRTTPAIDGKHVASLDEATSPLARRDQFRQRHLSEIRTNDILSSPVATSSPTAVPLLFRRLPVSPSFVRSASVGSTSAGSPMTTPRTRQGRPTSTEFRNSKEFRPLYLVEQHSRTKQPESEVEEIYPSLPSSRTSSAHSSMENLRGDDQGELYAGQQISPSQARDSRHSISYWRDERPTSPDYLDSRTATPTATEFPKEVKREKPKYEFHSPSELLQDPSSQSAGQNVDHSPSQSPMVLPSVGSPASSVAKNDSSTHNSRPSSPARDQRSVDDNSLAPSIGLGLVGGAAAALAASQLFEHEDAAVTAEEPLHMRDSQDLPEPSATSTTSLDQTSKPVDPPTMSETEAVVAPQAAGDESTVLSVSRKKSKKDKKKKKIRKTLDLTDESIEDSSSSLDVPELLDNVDPLGAKAITEQRLASQASVRDQDLPSEITISDIAVPTQPKHDVLDTQPPASTKSADMEDVDISTTGHVDERSLPQAETEKGVPLYVEDMTDSKVSAEKPSEKAAEEDDLAFGSKELKEDEEKEFASTTQIADPEVVQPVLQGTDKSPQDMTVDKSSVTPDEDVTTPKSPSPLEEKIETQIPQNNESMPAAAAAELVQQDRDLSSGSTFEAPDDTDRTEGLDKEASRDPYPFNEPTATPEVDTAALSGPSPLEEAFAKAKAARGTAPEISEEEAFQAFQPPAGLEPWHGSGRLETIVESSREGSKVDSAQLEEAVENVGGDQGLPSRSKSKKNKKKDKAGKKSKISTEVEAMEAEPDDTARDNVAAVTQCAQEETEIVTDPLLSVESVNAIPISDASINPFGNDYVLTGEDNTDDKPVDTSRELESADASQLEDLSAAATPLEPPEQIVNAPSDLHDLVEEPSWTPTSKKDKKKSKKGRTTALISDASTPVTEMSSTESIDQPQARQLDEDSSAVSTKRGKKGKKEKKKSQVLDFAAEDESGGRKTMQDGLEQPEEPTRKAPEIKQDASTQETADDVIVLGGKKGKKSKKKKNQAVDWTNEAATPQTEESVDTTAESQRDISIGEAETEDLAWTTTKKSKKDKKGSKKPALPEETSPPVDVAQNLEPLSIPVPLEEPVSALNNESVPRVLDEVSLPRDEASIPTETSIPTEASIPRDEASVSRDEDQLPPHNHEVSEAVEAKQLSVPDLADQHVSGAFEGKELQESQVIRELSEPREVEPQASEPVEAPTLVPHSTDEHEVAAVQDTLEGSDPKDVPWQTAEVKKDEEAGALRDLRWASVFGELKQRKASRSTEAPRQISEVAEGQETSAVRASGWASVFGELKERTSSKAARGDDQLVPVREVEQGGHLSVLAGEDHAQMSITNLEQQRQASVPVGGDQELLAPSLGQLEQASAPAGGDQEELPAPSLGQPEQASAPAEVDQQTITLKAGTELPARTESKQEQIPEQTHEPAPEQLLPNQAVPPEHIQDGQQAHRADLEDKSSQMVSLPIVVAEGVRDQSRDLVHDQTPQESQESQESQEPAMKSLPQPGSEWQEATSSGSGMISDDRLESNSHEAVQPQSTLQIERSGEAGVTAEAPHEVALPEPSSQVDQPVEADVTADAPQEVALPEPSGQVSQPIEADITADTSREVALPEPSSQINQPVEADITADAPQEVVLPGPSSQIDQPVEADVTADVSQEVALPEPSRQVGHPPEADVTTDASQDVALPEPSSQVEQPVEAVVTADVSQEVVLPKPSSQVQQPVEADITADTSYGVASAEPSDQVEQQIKAGDASHENALSESSSQVEQLVKTDVTADTSHAVALPEPSSQVEQSIEADVTTDASHEATLPESPSQIEEPIKADITTDASHEIALPELSSQIEQSVGADIAADASHEVALPESSSQVEQLVKTDITADTSHEVALGEPSSQIEQRVEADVTTDASHETTLLEPSGQVEEPIEVDITTDAPREVALPEPSNQPIKADLTADASHEVALPEPSGRVEQSVKADTTTDVPHEVEQLVEADESHEIAPPEPLSQIEEPVKADTTTDASHEVEQLVEADESHEIALPEPLSQIEESIKVDTTTDASHEVEQLVEANESNEIALPEPLSQIEESIKADTTTDASHEVEQLVEEDESHEIAPPEPLSQIEESIKADLTTDASHEVILSETSSQIEQPVKADLTADASREVALSEPSSQVAQPTKTDVTTDASHEAAALIEPSSQVEQPAEADITTDASHEVALPETSSQVEQLIEADETADAPSETVQPEALVEIERPDESEIIANPSSTPTQVIENQADEVSRAPTQKRKKDKKSKKSKSKQSTINELTEPSTELSRSNDILPDSVVAVASTEGTETPTTATTAEEPSTEADEFSWGPAKKSKKDKKKKSLPFAEDRSILASDDFNESRSSIPWPESPAHLSDDVGAERLTPDEKQPANDVSTENEIQSHTADMPSLPKQVEGSSLTPPMSEERQTTLEDDETIEAGPEHDATQKVEEKGFVTESEEMREEPSEYTLAATPDEGKMDKNKQVSTLETSEPPTPQMEDEPPSVQDTVNLAATPRAGTTEEDERAFSTKKSKKDRKKRGSIPGTSQLTTPEVQDERSAAEDTVVSATTPRAGTTEDEWAFSTKKSKKDKKKRGLIPETSQLTTPEVQDESLVVGDIVVPAMTPGVGTTEEDEWAFSTKKSKKDKKHGSILETSQLTTTDVQDERSVAEDTVTQATTPRAGTTEDEWAFSTKKSKKDRKKRGSILETSQLTTPDAGDERSVAEDTMTQATTPKTEPTEEDEWAFSTKKGKKDKKKRGSILETSQLITPDAEDERSVTEDTVTQATTPRAGTTEDEWAFSTKKSKKDKKKRGLMPETSQLTTPEVQDERPAAEDNVVLATTPTTEPTEEDEWAFSTKKGKKDKKKKNAALTPVEVVAQSKQEEDMQANRDMSPPVEPEIDRDIIEQPHPDILAIPIVEQNPEDQTVGSSPELAKAEAVGSATERELTSGVSESQTNADQVEEQPVVVNKSVFGDESAMEDQPIVATEEDSSWTPAPKQSKKDKKDKKKRKSTVVLDEPPEDTSSSVNATDSGKDQTVLDHRVVDESSPISGPDHAAEVEAIVGTRTAVEPGGSVEEDVSMATEAIEETQHSGLVEPEGPAEDDSWAFTTKKSKKDKKKKRQSKVNLEESAPENTDSMASVAAVREDIPEEEKQPLTELSDFNATPEADTYVAPVSNSPDLEERTGETEPVVELQEDAQVFTTKKSKKEKKTKRKSVIDSEEGITGTISASAAAEEAATAAVDRIQEDAEQSRERGLGLSELPEDETAPRSPSEHPGLPEGAKELGTFAEHTESVQKLEPAGEPSEDTWGFSTKKNKKDKKKKHRSTFDEYHSTSSTPATPSERTQADQDIVVPANEQARDLTSEKNETFEPEEPALAIAEAPPSQVVEDDFPPIRKKKSKKDKKKRALLSWSEENDASAEQTTETSTPANELELGKFGEQEPALYASEETAKMPEAKSVDLDSSPVQESAADVEDSLPAVQQHFNFTEHSMAHLAQADARELAPAGNTAEAEDDGDWGFSTTKRGKKTKANKDVADSPVAVAGDERRDIDSLDDNESHSLRPPGSFDDEPQSGPQLWEVPEIEGTREERSVQSTREVSNTTTDAATTGDEVEFTTKPSKKGKKRKKGDKSFYLSSNDARPTEAVSEQTVSKDYAGDQGQSISIGLGIAAQAAASQDTGDRNLSNEDELPGQYEASHDAVNDQAIPHQEEQDDRALLLSDRSPELPTAPEAPEARSFQSGWSFANLKQDSMQEDANRDSGIQVFDSPLIQAGHIPPPVRDSGYVPSPVAPASRESSTREEGPYGALARPPRPISPTSSFEDLRPKAHDHSMRSQEPETIGEIDDVRMHPSGAHGFRHNLLETPSKRQPSPVDSMTKDRSSALFNSSPSNRTDAYGATPRLDTRHIQSPVTDLHRSPSVHGHGHRSREDLRSLTPSRSPTRHLQQTSDAPIVEPMQEVSQQPHRSIFGPFPTGDEHDRGLSPPRTPLQTIHEHVIDTSPSNRVRRHLSDVGSPGRDHTSVGRSSAPDLGRPAYRLDTERSIDAFHTQEPPGQPSAVESERAAQSVAERNHSLALAEVAGLTGIAGAAAIAGLGGVAGAAAIADEELGPSSRDEETGDAKSLGKSKSRSTSSKQLRRSQVSLENIASSSTHDPVREKGKAAARDMAEVYNGNGYGEFPAAPMSPTRPPSVRKRQSMQQIKDLEARLDQLVSENRLLAKAKINAEQQLQNAHFAQSRADHASQEALELRDVQLKEKDEVIEKMREALDALQKEVARLKEVNEGLTVTHEEMRSTHEQRYSQLEEQHAETHQQWQESSRELEDLRSKHTELSTGMEEIVQHELDARLAEKDAEIHRLYDELEDAKAKIRELQQQILAGQSDDVIVIRDEDYFDNACQQLCQHVQQWVLRFSKFSDTRICRLTREVRDEKIVDRFENAILDGSDVDIYLADRVKRRDVFMSVVMTMIWEYIFTRYLFGMDREQRQKLKQLEKNLSDVGPPSSVHRWRAMTLTLLSKRESFKGQRASDTEAVVQEIYSTLARFLPPPQALQGQIKESLRNVMKAAVDLSIEMRTQRAEYIMLPPLQPEYDLNGDLARKVYFNAALMNERSGETTSNDELEAEQAVVRMVLFPLVVKKGSDTGEGDEEIVVCPAQVLVARSGKDKKAVRVLSGDRMSIDQASRSVQSFAPSVLDPANVI